MADDSYSQRPWLALYPPGFGLCLQPRFTDLLSAFRHAVAMAPDRVALRYFDTELTWMELDAASGALACAFAADGVGPGDRVSIILQNTPAFVIAALAAWKLAAVPTPSNPMYRSEELTKVFADCTPAVFVCEPAHAVTVLAARDAARLHARPIFVADPRDGQRRNDPRVLGAAPCEAPHGAKPVQEEIAAYAGCQPSRAVIGGDALGLLLYTSGTTGAPKGVMIRHESLAFNAQSMGEWGGLSSASRVLGVAPLFHITGFVSHLAMVIIARCELILHYRFEPGLVLDILRETRPTYTVGAITAFNALMNAPGASPEDFSSFDRVFSGGAAIAPSLAAELKARLEIDVRPCYGMTETCSPTHAAPGVGNVPVDPATGALAIGIPTFSTEARIVGEDGEPTPVGEPGELWIQGPQIMSGYWRKPSDTAEALVDGWMRSGDIAVMNAEGWFFLVDRKKDMINASGFKVWPREVEDCLYGHPAVREAAVVGAPDPYRGESVVAYVALNRNEADAASLIAHCRERLAAYKCPRRIELLAELPKTATGKIQRNLLRDEAASTGV